MTNPKSQDSKPKPYDIRERTLLFALDILDLTARLPDTKEGNVVRAQLAKSGSSVGANVEDGDGSVSRREVRRIYAISRREARESRFWLRIIEHKWPHLSPAPLVEEATQLLHILSAIVEKLH